MTTCYKIMAIRPRDGKRISTVASYYTYSPKLGEITVEYEAGKLAVPAWEGSELYVFKTKEDAFEYHLRNGNAASYGWEVWECQTDHELKPAKALYVETLQKRLADEEPPTWLELIEGAQPMDDLVRSQSDFYSVPSLTPIKVL